MKSFIQRSFNIQEGEGNVVLLLFLQSFFLGIFFSSFEIGASSLFMTKYEGDIKMLAVALAISPVIGIILTGAYSKLQSSINFKALSVVNLLFICATTILLRIGFQTPLEENLIFFFFLLIGPLTILTIVGFWGSAGRIFSLRQGKRLFGILDSGQIVGAIVAGFAIPVFLEWVDNTENLLIISSISCAFALVLQLLVARLIKDDENEKEQKKEEKKSLSLKDFFKNRFILTMSVYAALSFFVAYFIWASFLNVSNIQFPTEDELTIFFGQFIGSLMILSIIIKTFAYTKLMKTYGIKVSLIIQPIILLVVLGASIAVGLLVDKENADSFLFFFLLVALARFFSKMLKDSIEIAAFKIIYQPLDTSIRHDVKA